MSILFYIAVLISFISLTLCTIPSYDFINGEINNNITVNISMHNISVIYYDYSNPQLVNLEKPLKISIVSSMERNLSVLVIIKDGNSVVNSIELVNQYGQEFVTATRIICPNSNIPSRILSVEISSLSNIIISVIIRVFVIQDFILKQNDARILSVTPNSPTYFLYKFESDVQKIAVNVISKDNICMILSIQHAPCPVHDNIMSVKYSGVYQTVMEQGAMIVQKKVPSSNKFFIVFVLNNNDEVCNGVKIFNIITNKTIFRIKDFSLSVKAVNEDYLLPILGAVGFYLLFYIASPLISLVYKLRYLKNFGPEEADQQNINRSLEDPAFYTSFDPRDRAQTLKQNKTPIPRQYAFSENEESCSTSNSLINDINADSIESVSNNSVDRINSLLNSLIYVADLSKKDSVMLDRKYFLYLWYLIIISVFYALPVVQLLINYQQTFDSTGNQDICYYNFRCTRPLYIFTAFNNIISNIGYVLLGILFTLITWRRHLLYNESKLRLNQDGYNLGIPQYYGLFYAMGVSLTMEGILSACYHICPSHNNFQFDTAYMYILACLCMIKIYQIRHPDINATAHSFFMTMAFLIFIGVIGVVYNKLVFWCIFTIMYMLLSLFLACEIYFLGDWKLDFGLPVRVYLIVINYKWKCLVPVYKSRMIIIIVTNIINFAFAIYGIIERPANFSSNFLAIFMINLLLYFFIYILMKAFYREPFYHLSIIYVLVAALCWGFSIYCFIKHPTDWQDTPAESRKLNADCIFLEFYDIHDVWHFLSSLSMFFSFMALLYIDDSLFTVKRESIPVF